MPPKASSLHPHPAPQILQKSKPASPSPTSSHTLSLEPSSPSQPQPKIHEASRIIPDVLAQYQHEITYNSTYCDFDLSGEESSGSEYEEHQKKRIARYEKWRAEKRGKDEGVEKEEEEDWDDLPLVDVWVARAKGWSLEECRRMRGGDGDEEEEEQEKEAEKEGGSNYGLNGVPAEVLFDMDYAQMCRAGIISCATTGLLSLNEEDDPEL